MLDKCRGGMRLVFWCVMLVEAGLDSEYGVGGKGDAHKDHIPLISVQNTTQRISYSFLMAQIKTCSFLII